MFALVTANIVNVVFNWILIFGHLGAPAMGVRGLGLGDGACARDDGGASARRHRRRERGGGPGLFETPLRVRVAWMRRLIGLGLPAATQITLEVGVFAAATALAGRLPPAALAAHQIAVNFAAFTFMVPLGVASAGAVRVGQAVGRRDLAGAARVGLDRARSWRRFMACAALVVPRLSRAC